KRWRAKHLGKCNIRIRERLKTGYRRQRLGRAYGNIAFVRSNFYFLCALCVSAVHFLSAMRVFLDQIGCRLNYSEMETLAQRLRAVGHQVVAAPEQAQVMVFNSCAVTAEAAKTSRQRIRQLHRSNTEARLAVTGCWVTLEPDAAAALPGVALVADNQRKDLIHLLLEPWSTELDDPADLARIQPNGTPFEMDSNVS